MKRYMEVLRVSDEKGGVRWVDFWRGVNMTWIRYDFTLRSWRGTKSFEFFIFRYLQPKINERWISGEKMRFQTILSSENRPLKDTSFLTDFRLLSETSFRSVMGDKYKGISSFLKRRGTPPISLADRRDVFEHSLEASRNVLDAGLHAARWL